MTSGIVFQIQRWSIHDGEGIRSTVFLKGCPLRCAWCANPESWSGAVEGGFGFTLTIGELMARLRRDEVFYRESGGGVTFSGGEPLAQPDFLLAALKACGACGYDRAIETSACGNINDLAAAAQMCEEVFVDIKHMDSMRHKMLTGVPNEGILRNIAMLLAHHGRVTLRVPLVAGVNDDEDNIRALCAFCKGAAGLRGVEFMPYHNLGLYKYSHLGLPEPAELCAPSAEKIASLKRLVEECGLEIVSK